MPDMTLDQTFDAGLREHQAGNLADAEALYRQVLLADRDNADALHLLGVLALQAGQAEPALVLINRAIAIKAAAAFFGNQGLVLAALGKWDEAIAAYRQALKLSPDDVSRLDNLAVALREAGQLDEAQTLWDRAMQLRPDDPELHFNRSLAYLLAGDYGRGWAEYEWRWQSKHSAGLRRHGEIPRWSGEDLAGRTLLLHGEQGYGDALQFIRYTPLVKAR